MLDPKYQVGATFMLDRAIERFLKGRGWLMAEQP